jgi:hypothetical protein
MGEYEPNDSRNVTLSNHTAPGEPPRTGPREGEARAQSHIPESGEQGERAAPQPGVNLKGEPVDQASSADPQASQSQWQGGQSQSMGGMSQSLGGSGQQGQQPSAAPRSGADSPEQFGGTATSTSAPSGSTGDPAAWAADFPSDQAEAASGHSMEPQNMQQNDPDSDAERTRREQAAAQDRPDAPQGLGYGAEDGEEMGDAPDLTDPSQRGYGGAGEARLKKLEEGS